MTIRLRNTKQVFTADVVVDKPVIVAWAALADQLKVAGDNVHSKVSGNPFQVNCTFVFQSERADKRHQEETVVLTDITIPNKLVYKRTKRINTKFLGIIERGQIKGSRIDTYDFLPHEDDNMCILRITEQFRNLSHRLKETAGTVIQKKAAAYQRYINNTDTNEVWDFIVKKFSAVNIPLPPGAPVSLPAHSGGALARVTSLIYSKKSASDSSLPENKRVSSSSSLPIKQVKNIESSGSSSTTFSADSVQSVSSSECTSPMHFSALHDDTHEDNAAIKK